MSTSTALLRVALLTGSGRLDLAVTPEARLADILHSAGIDAEATMVTSTAGTEIDLHAPIAEEISDGAVLSVVADDRTTPARSGRARDTPTRFQRLPAGLAGWVVCGLGLALCVVIVASHAANLLAEAGPYPRWLGVGAPVLLGATGMLLAVRRMPRDGRADRGGTGSDGPPARESGRPDGAARGDLSGRADHGLLDETVLAPVFGFASGFLVAEPGQYGALRLGLVLALLSASVLAVLRYAVSRREMAPSHGIAAVLAGVWTAVAALFALALLLDLPAYVMPALILGAAPLMIRSMPSAALDIPEEQALDMPFLARTAMSVRGVLPRSPARVRLDHVSRRIRQAEHRERAGMISASVLVAAMVPVVLAGYEPGGLRGWGTVALVALLVLFLTLAPRSFRRPADKLPPRLALFSVLVQLAVGVHRFPDALAWGIVLIVAAVGFAFLAVPLARGYRSVRFSRMGDILEAITVGLVLPAALLAAGAVEGLQTLTAR